MAKKKNEIQSGPKQIQNRKARYDYEIVETFEAGVMLVGSEVKSVWQGNANISDAYCQIKNGEAWLINADIEPYENASHFQPDRRRDRKLLLHKREIEVIERRSLEKGFAIVPTRLYFNHGRVKAEIALGRGKKSYDKRDQIAKDDARREVERARSERY